MTKFLDTKGLERVISKLKTLIAGKADKSHTHTKSQISDFPKSLPASDVAAWAKAATKPGYSWGEISSKPSTFAPSSHTHSQYLTSHQSLADYYTKTDCDSKFQAKGSYAAANHTHSQYLTSIMDLVVAEFSGQGSLSHIFPAGSIKKDVRIIICGSPSGDPSLNENSLPAAMTDGYCVEILSLFYSMSVTLHMPFMMFSQNNWYKGSSIRISPGILYRFICYNGALWNMRKID